MQTENRVTDWIFTDSVRSNRSCHLNGFGTRPTRFGQAASISIDDILEESFQQSDPIKSLSDSNQIVRHLYRTDEILSKTW